MLLVSSSGPLSVSWRALWLAMSPHLPPGLWLGSVSFYFLNSIPSKFTSNADYHSRNSWIWLHFTFIPVAQHLNLLGCFPSFCSFLRVLLRPWFALSYQSCQRPDPLLSHLVWWQLSTSEQKRKESSLTDPWCCWGDSGSLDPESPLGKRTWCQSTGNRLKTHSP